MRSASSKRKLPGAMIRGVAADLGTAQGVQDFTTQVPEADILVNNLGIFDPKPFLEIEDAEWERFFQVNVMSGVRLSRHYLPGMIKRNWGRIVFISSEFGVQIPVEMVHYGMTKTAQLAVSRGLAETVAGTGVTVNAVLPGPTRSDGVVDFFGKLARDQGRLGRGVGGRVHPAEPAVVADPPPRRGRGGREHGRLRLLAASLGHHRRGAARRRRRRPLDRVSSKMP